MNKLGLYLRDNGLTYAAFGAQIGKTRSTVSRIVAGQVNVDRETAHAIYEATAGAVTPNDLFGLGDEGGVR
ncbi:MAG: helix-turn-helix transcriptional regulator [Alphaproteobacteria bacterium]|nr:helix-turn-helix transcriptional regulator [Alphaproteobacteria bacterium]